MLGVGLLGVLGVGDSAAGVQGQVGGTWAGWLGGGTGAGVLSGFFHCIHYFVVKKGDDFQII